MGHLERPRRIVGPGAGTDAATNTAASAGTREGAAPGGAFGAPTAVGGARPTRREHFRPRGRELRDTVATLDSGLDERACRTLTDRVRAEYDTAYGVVPLGLLARCHLGPPYVDHQLDLFGVILRHFAPSDPVPTPFAAARTLVRSGGYAYVEVYTDGLLIPVLDDGTAVRP
ncbi:hypothetical protein RB200_42245 [Streptomyces sp. PmtG]